MVTKVVHCKKEKYDVYGGRPGKFGNPYTNIRDKKTAAEFVVDTVDEAIEKCREYIMASPELIKEIEGLKGETIGCWCKPKPCHCSIFLDIIQAKFGGERVDAFTLIN